MASKCGRMPSKHIVISQIPKGTPIIDCGSYWVADLPGGKAMVSWEGRYAIESQSRLRRASIRGSFQGVKRRRRRRK